MTFIGRERELASLNELYRENKFQMFVLYGRRRVGKTTLLNEFCKDKPSIFYSAEQSNRKLNLEKFSDTVFSYYGETTLEPFSSWENAITYIDNRQGDNRLVLVLDEFPYLCRKDMSLLSELQHLIDHKLQYGKLFLVLCGSYMGFMEKEVLGSKSPLFGRRTGQLHMKTFDYKTSLEYMNGFSDEEKLMLYGAFGGTPLYLSHIDNSKSFEENIKHEFLKTTAYLYEEPLLLLRQEVVEPGVYSSIIEAIASGATKSNEIATKIGEEPAKCLRYISILCDLGILYKETPFGEKDNSRKTIYGISDLMFRFWYRYVFPNRTLIETGASEAVYKRRFVPSYNEYMGIVFERICMEYLLRKNSLGELPIMFTSIGRWWGHSSEKTHTQVEIDLIARDGIDYIFCECKWRNEIMTLAVLNKLKESATVFSKDVKTGYYMLFSKSGFSDSLIEEAKNNSRIILIGLDDITA
ncbi:MAG: ATP-binding protein [Oscillospiraceae bacterium]|nr:ATP-binding protein [Oscillospiraceae bacterium]